MIVFSENSIVLCFTIFDFGFRVKYLQKGSNIYSKRNVMLVLIMQLVTKNKQWLPTTKKHS